MSVHGMATTSVEVIQSHLPHLILQRHILPAKSRLSTLRQNMNENAYSSLISASYAVRAAFRITVPFIVRGKGFSGDDTIIISLNNLLKAGALSLASLTKGLGVQMRSLYKTVVQLTDIPYLISQPGDLSSVVDIDGMIRHGFNQNSRLIVFSPEHYCSSEPDKKIQSRKARISENLQRALHDDVLHWTGHRFLSR